MSGQAYSLPLSASPEPEVSATSEVVPNDWLTPTTVAYHDQYMTPFPTTVIENQPWSTFAKPLMPAAGMAPPVLSTTFPQQYSPQFYMANTLSRPRSSPSTFGPSPDSIPWPVSAGLGIQYPPELPTTAAPADLFEHEPDLYTPTPKTPILQSPMPRRPYQNIAPNPAGTAAVAAAAKRRRDEEEQDSDPGSGKRRRRTGSVNSADLSEDDRYLVRLKEDESLPWKEIATRFSTDKGKHFQVPALQMRYKRLREKFRMWEEQDVQALKQAHEYWSKCKWEIITQKQMTEYGSPERWPTRSVARKWQELEASMAVSMAATSGMTPAMTQYTSSPADAPMHFAFLPM